MSSWGPGLYQDDLAKDVRDYYRDQLRKGKSGYEITEELTKQYAYSSDSDDSSIFWFALADIQWDLGRLEDSVKEQALSHIRSGYDLRRWKEENPMEAKKRAEILSELEQKLLTPQPSEKSISQYKLYHCEWKIGDVFAYPLNSDYAKEKGLFGRYFLINKINETTWHPGHTVPVVRVKITDDNHLPSDENSFDKLGYVQTSITKYEDRFLPFDARYSICLLYTSPSPRDA